MICSLENCKRKAAVIVGHCAYCSKGFCLTHRLPEQHKCSQICQLREIASSKLKKKLNDEAINTKNFFPKE